LYNQGAKVVICAIFKENTMGESELKTTASYELLSFARPLIDLLLAEGEALQTITDKCGIDALALNVPAASITVASFNSLWELACLKCGPVTGLLCAKYIKLVDLQELGLLLTASENVEEWIRQLQRYSQFLTTLGKMECSWNGDVFEVSLLFNTSVPQVIERLDNGVMIARTLAEQYLTSPLQFNAVAVTRPKPANPEIWETAFNCPVQWSADVTKVFINRAEAERGLITRNPAIKEAFQLLLDNKLSQRNGADPMIRIRAAVTQQISKGDLALTNIASALNCSSRSLQRRLKSQGTTFNELVATVRREFAQDQLRQGSNIAEIAYYLGYSETSAFHRAFKQWTGQTPQAYATEYVGLAQH
jgi:AraC-like DNA-binding protein